MPTATPTLPRTHALTVTTVDFTGCTFSDQTGCFPVVSRRGYKCVMILYSHDANAILAEPIKSRAQSELIRAYTTMQTTLIDKGFTLRLHILDNEAPLALQHIITSQQASFQLVPPNIHHRNAAECVIQTFKDHFIAGLASTHPDFPSTAGAISSLRMSSP